MLTFAQLAHTSLPRAMRWHKGAFFTPGKPGYWNIAEWTNAAAGEMGEACNAAKKLRRLDEGMQQADGDSPAPRLVEESVAKLMKELGDTVIYLDLCAQAIRVRLEDCVTMAFNQISKREGFPERLPEIGVPFVSEYKGWRLVDTDNQGGDYPNEKFIDIYCMSEEHAKAIAKAINDGYGDESPRYTKVVKDTYTLQPCFIP